MDQIQDSEQQSQFSQESDVEIKAFELNTAIPYTNQPMHDFNYPSVCEVLFEEAKLIPEVTQSNFNPRKRASVDIISHGHTEEYDEMTENFGNLLCNSEYTIGDIQGMPPRRKKAMNSEWGCCAFCAPTGKYSNSFKIVG